MSRSTNGEFLTKLGELFAKTDEHGSVYLVQKRCMLATHRDYANEDELVAEKKRENGTEQPYAVLFRATDGKTDKKLRTKITTVVDPADLDSFWVKYTDAIKTGMGGLRKKEKKKKKAKK